MRGGMSSSDIGQIEAHIGTSDPKVRIANVRREAGDAVSLQSYRLLRTTLVHAYNQAT